MQLGSISSGTFSDAEGSLSPGMISNSNKYMMMFSMKILLLNFDTWTCLIVIIIDHRAQEIVK